MLGRNIVFKKKYIAFFSITGIVLLTALIKVPCPVCDGSGKVSTAFGMENVYIADLKYDQKYLNMDFCMGYTLYKYTVNLTLTNSGSETATGWIKFVLKGLYEGNVLDIKYVGVEIPGASTVSNAFSVWFQTAFEIPPAVTVDAQVEFGGVTCLTCSGSGSVPVNVWLMAKGLKNNLQRIIRMEQEFKPPPYVIPLPPEGE